MVQTLCSNLEAQRRKKTKGKPKRAFGSGGAAVRITGKLGLAIFFIRQLSSPPVPTTDATLSPEPSSVRPKTLPLHPTVRVLLRFLTLTLVITTTSTLT